MRLLALGDRNPDFQPQVGSSQSGELHPVLSAWLRAAAAEASAAALGGLII